MKSHLNLLPRSVIQRQVVRSLLRSWAYVAGIVMLLAIAWTIYEEHLTTQAQQRLTKLQTSYDATNATLRNVRLLRSELAKSEQRQATLPADDSQRRLLTLLGLLSSAAETNTQGVAVNSFKLTLDTAPPAASTVNTHTLHVELRGVAADAVGLADFVASIRAWKVFTQVDLKSSSEVKVGTTPAHQFVVECIN